MYAGRIYTVAWDAATAVTAQIDVFEVAPADDHPVIIHELKMWQTSDLGDAQEEIIGIQFLRGFTTSGSGGGTSTAATRMKGDAAASFAHECRNTTLATTTTADVVEADGWNVRVPYIWTPSPEDRPWCTQAESRIVVRLMAAPADSLTMYATLKVEEVG
jgi:hypothetical protein